MMENCTWDIVGMTFQGMNTLLSLIIPNFNRPVITSRYDIRFITLVIINTINSVSMTSQCKIRLVSSRKTPNFNRSIQRTTAKGICFSRIDGAHHYIINVIIKSLNKSKSFFKVPNFDRRIIWSCNKVRLRRMNR